MQNTNQWHPGLKKEVRQKAPLFRQTLQIFDSAQNFLCPKFSENGFSASNFAFLNDNFQAKKKIFWKCSETLNFERGNCNPLLPYLNHNVTDTKQFFDTS